MGLLNAVADLAGDLLGGLLDQDTKPGSIREPDYKDGFVISELDSENGFKVLQTIQLSGNLKPMVPFKTGGEQNITKDYYPGNPEPAVQILGPQESDVVIEGRFYAKRLNDPANRNLPTALRDELDAIRYRGSVVKIQLGEWTRHAILRVTEWSTKHEAEVGYKLTFDIISFDTPSVCPVLQQGKVIPFETKNNLQDRLDALQEELTASPIPESLPGDIAGLINGITSDIAEIVNVPLNFIDGIISDAEDITDSITRAVGVMKKAKADISFSRTRLGRISYQLDTAGVPVPDRFKTARIMSTTLSFTNDFSSLLAKLQSQFEKIKETIPLSRHKVRDGQTLQNIANEYYSDSQQWKGIYDHNSLTTTALTAGTVLEIPKL